MPLNYNDRRILKLDSLPLQRERGSGLEGGGNEDLSNLTQRDPVLSHSILQEPRASSENRHAQSLEHVRKLKLCSYFLLHI